MALILDHRQPALRPRTATLHSTAMHCLAVASIISSFGCILSVVIGLF
jgi:hypothetical protein